MTCDAINDFFSRVVGQCDPIHLEGPAGANRQAVIDGDSYFATRSAQINAEATVIRQQMGLSSPENFDSNLYRSRLIQGRPSWILDLAIRKESGERLTSSDQAALDSWERHPGDVYRATLAKKAKSGEALTPFEAAILASYEKWERRYDDLRKYGSGSGAYNETQRVDGQDMYIIDEASDGGFRRTAYLEALEETGQLNTFTESLLEAYRCRKEWYPSLIYATTQIRALAPAERLAWKERTARPEM